MFYTNAYIINSIRRVEIVDVCLFGFVSVFGCVCVCVCLAVCVCLFGCVYVCVFGCVSVFVDAFVSIAECVSVYNTAINTWNYGDRYLFNIIVMTHDN